MTVMVAVLLVLLVAPSEDRLDTPLPPGVDLDPTTIPGLEGLTWLVPPGGRGRAPR